jgi:hypothetical protein
MDIQSRKLQFIQDFLRYADDSIVEKFEMLLESLRKTECEKSISKITIEQYEARINKAFDDVKNNRIKSTEDLQNDILTWS